MFDIIKYINLRKSLPKLIIKDKKTIGLYKKTI